MTRLFAVLMIGVALVALLRLRKRIYASRPPWNDVDLSTWHAEHQDPAGDVWAVVPPDVSGLWALYRPGAPIGGPFPYEGVRPDGSHVTTGASGGDHGPLFLVDVADWMRPWVERVAGGQVVEMVEMVEGWSEPYGPRLDMKEYVIYARVSR